jgi:hypothetical protein
MAAGTSHGGRKIAQTPSVPIARFPNPISRTIGEGFDVVEIEDLSGRKARLAYLPKPGQQQPYSTSPEHLLFPDQAHYAYIMRREITFEDNGHARQDRKQEHHAQKVHRISTYSLRYMRPRDLAP